MSRIQVNALENPIVFSQLIVSGTHQIIDVLIEFIIKSVPARIRAKFLVDSPNHSITTI